MQNNNNESTQASANEALSQRLRRARLAKRLRLADLAEQVECSESYLSKVENNRATPSLKILHRIAAALGMSIAELFAEGSSNELCIGRKDKRAEITFEGGEREGGITLEQLAPFDSSRLLEAHVHVIAPGAENGGVIRHEGEEVGYVAEGEFELMVNGQLYTLKQGDSFFFPSDLPHSYRNVSSATARVVWVSTPLTF